MKRTKSFFTICFDIFTIVLMFAIWADAIISTKTSPYVTSELSDVHPARTGLLLGTSRTRRNGTSNAYFYNRIDAAVKLYRSGKIKYILVSGDNSSVFYNEPRDMRDALIERGIPSSAIFLDYAGFRTLDSILRARDIFGQDSYIVISQQFHNERAVFLARRMGIEAYGYNAEDVSAYFGFKTKFREFFARSKVFVDLLMDVQPKFSGEKVKIG